MNLPVNYDKLTTAEKRKVREEYVTLQNGKCYYCNSDLDKPVPWEIRTLPIDWKYFPPGFLRSPIHLQHNHDTGMTEGAVHAYCNAVMWQYENK